MGSPFIDPAARHPYLLGSKQIEAAEKRINDPATPEGVRAVLRSEVEAFRATPPDQQYRYFFRVMNVRENAAFADFLIYKQDDKGQFIGSNENAQRVELLRYSLTGWEGPGVPEFKKDTKGYPTDETLARLHGQVLYELSHAANDVNLLASATTGKS